MKQKSQIWHNVIFQKRFKRLKRIQAEESDEEQEVEQGHERDAVATELFEGSDNVSKHGSKFALFCFYFTKKFLMCVAALSDYASRFLTLLFEI